MTTRLADIIDSKEVLEYRIASAFRDKNGLHLTEDFGGVCPFRLSSFPTVAAPGRSVDVGGNSQQ